MMTFIYAEPSRGKTLAALAAFPNAAIATTKAESVEEPAKLYGIDIPPDRVCEVGSLTELSAFFKKHKDRPRIIDDLSDLLGKAHTQISRSVDSPQSYGVLNDQFIPYLRALSERSATPTVITAWAKPPAEIKDLTGTKQLQPGGWAAPGGVMRATVPGLCTHYLRIRAQSSNKSNWPFEFQTTADTLWEAKCRSPASVPTSIPLALAGLYRAAGYECEPMFADQPKVRDAAYKILNGNDRAKGKIALAKVFDQAVSKGVSPHAVAYAVTEAQVQIAFDKHNESLASNLAGSFL